MIKRIYLDNSATTPVDKRVLAKMLPFYSDLFGNPSSIHRMGQAVRIPIEDARINVAKALHTEPARIVFTSGGTESDYMAVVGFALANKDKGNHIIISQIEHSAIIEATNFLKDFGFEITYLSVDKTGRINMEELKSSIKDNTILVSIMYVNNEIGTIQSIDKIGNLLKSKHICFHTDAVQAFPIIDFDISKLPIDLLSISSHKINGPKGVGALYIRKGIKLKPLIGGTQERLRRGGTENVPAIIGFGEACRILTDSRNEKIKKIIGFKNYMIDKLDEELGDNSFVVNGHSIDTVPSILNVSFIGIDSHTMIMNLDTKGIAVSGGSACASGAINISRVIESLGLPDAVMNSSIRISFGTCNTDEEIVKATKEIINIVKSRKTNVKSF